MSEDRPYLRPLREPTDWRAWIITILLIGSAGLYGWVQFYGLPFSDKPEQAPLPRVEPRPPAPAPAVRHPIAGPSPEAAASLPSLDQSDSMLRRGLSELLGRESFERFVTPDRLVRRIVATIDNLPRRAAPRRLMPVTAVPGSFAVEQSRGELAIAQGNYGRYDAFVSVAEAIDAGALARFYAQSYPLFQRAYEELGFGGRHFNDRVVEALDDLLAAPEPESPIRLERRRVLYEFADPELEALSAGRKMMLRMGPANAARLKKKLREIRQALVAPRPAG